MADNPSKPIEYKLVPSQWLEWTYPRPEGDLSVFAPTREDAARTMAEHGFHNLKPELFACTDRLLSDVLAKGSIT